MTACVCGAGLPGDCAFVAGHVDAELPGCLRDAPESEASSTGEEDGVFVRWASEIERQHVEWAVPGRVPAAMLTLLAGDPKLGKSMLSMLWAAELGDQGHRSLMLTAEDSVEITLRPRLEALQADLDLIGWAMLRRDGIEGGLSLPDDVPALEEQVSELRPRLVVVDPLMAHLGDRIDSHRDHSIRRALAPLHHMAGRHGCAVVVIVHLNKDSSAGSVLGRVGGSIGLSGAARSILLFARDPEDPEGERGRRRVLAHHACNVAEEAPSLRYEVTPILLPGNSTEPDLETARLVEIGVCDLLASDLLRGPVAPTPRDDARSFLIHVLSEEWQRVPDLKDRAHDEDIAWRTVQRASEELETEGLMERRRGLVGQPGEWRLSVAPQPDPAGGATEGGATEGGAPAPGVARRGATASEAASQPSVEDGGATTDDSVAPPRPVPRPGGATGATRSPLVGDDDFLPRLFAKLEEGVVTESEWHQADKAHRLVVAQTSDGA